MIRCRATSATLRGTSLRESLWLRFGRLDPKRFVFRRRSTAALHRTGVLERAGLSRTTRQLEGIFGQKGIPDPTAMMSQIMKKRSVSDHEFMERNALQPYDEFQLEELVGRGTSFFGSTTGSQPGGYIGK